MTLARVKIWNYHLRNVTLHIFSQDFNFWFVSTHNLKYTFWCKIKCFKWSFFFIVLIPNLTSNNVKAVLVNSKASLLQWSLILEQLQVILSSFCYLKYWIIHSAFVEGHGHGGWPWCFWNVLSNYKYSSSSALCHQLHMTLHAS